MIGPGRRTRSYYLETAINLAEMGRGRTNPNPMVGAVIVKNGRVIGRGYHARAGEPHAEIHALDQAGVRAKGATLFVSLEPCAHQGRTPPCVDAIRRSGIREVVAASIDPNPKVKGRGFAALRAAGIAVRLEPLEGRIALQNEVYFKHITTGTPFLLLKVAMSIDAKIAAPVGARTTFSSAEALHEVHKLRNEYQGVLVGIGTVLIDNPMLNCRLEERAVRQPVRIILDSNARLPLNCRIAQTASEHRTILVCTKGAKQAAVRALERHGIEIMVCADDKDGRVDLPDMLDQLGKREITSVLVEGGAAVNGAFLSRKLTDKLLLLISPVVIGSADTLPMLPAGDEAPQRFKYSAARLLDSDLLVEAYPVYEGRGD